MTNSNPYPIEDGREDACFESREAAEALREEFAFVYALRHQSQTNRIIAYKPTRKQMLFHIAGRKYRERALFTGNRFGKTFCIANECAYHSTGRYPANWPGRRLEYPNHGVVVGVDLAQMRDSCMKTLLGDELARGSGSIPRESLLGDDEKLMIVPAKDKKGAVDKCFVRHETGFYSSIRFMCQSMSQDSLMGGEYDWVWFDEQLLAADWYGQALARILTRNGMIMVSATPEHGRTLIVNRFLNKTHKTTWFIYASIREAEHMDEATREEIIGAYPEHEKKYRIEGIPEWGSGQIYKCPESKLRTLPYDIWSQRIRLLCGMDVGIGASKTALCFLAWIENTKTVVLWGSWRGSHQTADEVLIQWQRKCRFAGRTIPVAWPHDIKRKLQTGGSVLEYYEELGMDMLPVWAADEDEHLDVNYQCDRISQIMFEGRFQIFDTPENQPIFEELRSYYRDKENKVPKSGEQQWDDMDAMRYGTIMLLRGYGSDAGLANDARGAPESSAHRYGDGTMERLENPNGTPQFDLDRQIRY